MVRYLNQIHTLLPDDGCEPVGCISIGHWWIACDETLFRRPYSDVPDAVKANKYYNGPLMANHDPLYGVPVAPNLYNPADPRPTHDSIHVLDDNGALLLRPDAHCVPDIRGGHNYHTDYERHLVISTPNQSGDVPHVAAAMAFDPLLDVLLITADTNAGLANAAEITYQNAIRLDSTQVGHQAYEALKTYASRIKNIRVGSVEDAEAYYHGFLPDDNPDGDYAALGRARWHHFDADNIGYFLVKPEMWTYTNQLDGVAEYASMTVGCCTTLVANYFQNLGPDTFYNRTTATLTSNQVKDVDITNWANMKHLNFTPGQPRQKILILWSRYSGSKPGGYNPAGDSSIAGQKEIIDWARSTHRFDRVLTIGHDLDSTHPTPGGDFHLGEFWTEQNSPFYQKGRPAQTSFFALLLQRHDVVQVGQKTGGMDNAALIGVPTVYIEDVKSPQQGRMVKWSRVMQRYQRAAVSRPPTRLGQALRAVQTPQNQSDNLDAANQLLHNRPGDFEDGYGADIKVIGEAVIAMTKTMKWA